jgi:hypothetical protein
VMLYVAKGDTIYGQGGDVICGQGGDVICGQGVMLYVVGENLGCVV